MDIGVFIPIGNNGWLISKNSPQFKPSFYLSLLYRNFRDQALSLRGVLVAINPFAQICTN